MWYYIHACLRYNISFEIFCLLAARFAIIVASNHHLVSNNNIKTMFAKLSNQTLARTSALVAGVAVVCFYIEFPIIIDFLIKIIVSTGLPSKDFYQCS